MNILIIIPILLNLKSNANPLKIKYIGEGKLF